MATGVNMARRSGKEGSVLILTIWTLFFLGALAVAVGSYVSGGIRIARQASANAYGRAAMMAAVEHGCMLVQADTNQWDGFGEAWGYGGELDWEDQPLGETLSYSIHHTTVGGITNAGMIDEESRININKANKKILEALFLVVGGVDALESASLAAAVMDWRDEDNDVTTGGAEGGYYAGLKGGYRCHNGEFDSIYELLMIRGMTPELFERMASAVTIYGNGKVNLNTADVLVLEALARAAGADESISAATAAKIASFRHAGGSFSEANARSIAAAVKESGMLAAEEESILMRMMMYLSLKGSCFRGVAVGGRSGQWGQASIEFVYSRQRQRVLFWNER